MHTEGYAVMLAPAGAQKGEGSAAVDARRKELAAQRASAGLRGTKQFYCVTVRVRLLIGSGIKFIQAAQHTLRITVLARCSRC